MPALTHRDPPHRRTQEPAVTDAVSAAVSAFAPSELVLLYGDRFTPEAGLLASKEEVLTSGVKVNAQKLMDVAVSAAFWAVHRSGAATLEVRQGTKLFGLMKTHRLHIIRGTAPSTFPAGSLESVIVEASEQEPEVRGILESFIGSEVMDPAARVLGLMKAGLSGRDLLQAEERKTMKVFTTVAYMLPESTRAAAAREPLEPVHALLRDAEQREPELFKAVQKAIDGARVSMTESSD
jgi:hypothetical protein